MNLSLAADLIEHMFDTDTFFELTEAELAEGWQQKMERAQRGEQRWGFFMARRAA